MQVKKDECEIVEGELAAKLNEYMTRLSAYGFSGALLVAKDGGVVMHKGYGPADKEQGVPVTTKTLFDIGSISKQFTATAILHLEMQGKLSTGDLMCKYLDDVPEDKGSITIHHLLTHTSGYPDFVADFKIVTRDEAVKDFLHLPLRSAPGEQFFYSNPGYALCAAIVEKVSEQSFQSYLKEHLFALAEMSKTGWYGDSRWDEAEVAHGYNDSVDYGSPIFFPGPSWYLLGDGGVVSSVGELYKWELALRGDTILSADAKKKLFTPYVRAPPPERLGCYAYGWGVKKTDRGTTLIRHGGSCFPTAFTAEFRLYVDEDVVVILTTNKMIDMIGLAYPITENISKLVFDVKHTMPPTFVQFDPMVMRKYAGTYEIPSGAKFIVWVENDQLMIGAEGQEAVNLLVPLSQGTPDLRSDLNTRTLATPIIQGVRKGDFNPLKKAMTPEPGFDPREEFYEDLRSFEGRRGAFKALKILGTVQRLKRGEGFATTYVRIDFKRATDVYRLMWTDDKVELVLGGTQLPAITSLMPQSETDIVSFDLISSKILRITFNVEDDGAVSELTVHAKNRDVIAQKMKITQ